MSETHRGSMAEATSFEPHLGKVEPSNAELVSCAAERLIAEPRSLPEQPFEIDRDLGECCDL